MCYNITAEQKSSSAVFKGIIMIKYVYPEKIICCAGAEGANNLLKRKPLQIGLSEIDTTVFEGGYIILDFGKEMNGGARILTFQSDDVQARLRFGESLSETCAEIGGKTNATNDHSLRDFTVVLPRYSDMTFGQTGYRFLRVDFFGKAEIKSILGTNEMLSKRARYIYGGKDKRIAEIFKTARRTIDLCSAGGYVWDGIKRDRLVWIGDMHPEMLALTALYGRTAEVERSMDFVRDQTPLPGWMNRYPMYSMWWIIIVADYARLTGAYDYAEKQLDYMQALVRRLDGCVKDNGELDYPAYFVDWPTSGSPDEKHGVRAINIIAAKKAAELLDKFGRDSSVARRLLEKLLKIAITPEKSKQVTALKYFAVGLDEDDKTRLVDGGAKGMSTFMSYYILKAVASFNREKAVEMMKEYYGAMLDVGATSFWEDFDIDWTEKASRIDAFPKDGEKDIHADFGGYCYVGHRHSFCHGWSSGVIAFIKEECEN